MSLTPASTDPEQKNELVRRTKEPQSFGIGGLSDKQKKAASNRVDDHNKAPKRNK